MQKSVVYKQTEIGEIPENWILTTLGEISDIASSKRIFASEYQNDGIPFLRGKEIIEKHDGKAISTELFITQDKFNEIKNKYGAPEAGDILLTSVGTIGVPYRVGTRDKFYFKDGNLTWFRHFKDVDSKFLYFWLESSIGRSKLIESSIGSTQQALIIDALKKIELVLPSIVKQQQIASILSSLDDKIELNRKMNKTLEEIGKALFKRWFVDFEFPNNDGKPYKSSGGKMVDSELGEIPKEWEVGYLPDVAKIQKGLSYSGKDLADSGKRALVGLKCFERKGGFRIDGIKYYNGEFKNDHLLETGDLVVAMTDLTQAAEVIGNPALVPFIPNVDIAVASLDVSILKPTSYLSREYLYLLLTRQESQDFLYGYTNGSTVLHLSIKGLYEFKLLVPSPSLIDMFNVLVENMFSLIRKNQHENINLTALRDSLLPRLMSGKLRLN